MLKMGVYDDERDEYYPDKSDRVYIDDDAFDDVYDSEYDAELAIESYVYSKNIIEEIVDDYTAEPDSQIPEDVTDYEEAFKYIPEGYVEKWRDRKYDELVHKIKKYEEDNDDYGWYTR